MYIPVGISSCLLGHKVRFDGSDKGQKWAKDVLTNHFDFRHLCPEMAAGMPTPRDTLRLVQNEDELRMVTTKDQSKDWTDKVSGVVDQHKGSLMNLCGYVLTAKSPSCGMERVRVYSGGKSNQHVKNGVGLFTRRLSELFPWMPMEEDGRLNDPVLRENFIMRVFALHDLNQSVLNNPSADALVKFHSRYKLMYMAHSQELYRELGRQVANVGNENLDAFLINYRQKFMDTLAIKVHRKRHVNVLMHIMGYFKKQLSSNQKAELLTLFEQYNQAHIPLMAPLTLINHYLNEYPNKYLTQQVYLQPYPVELSLRYGM